MIGINELIKEYIQIKEDSTIEEAYRAGFKECSDFIEKTFKNKQIMLSLRAILENKKAVQVVNRRNTNSPDMTIETKEGKTMITLSQAYFDKADLQNNRIMAAFEPGDHKIYFIVHNDESLYSDFMRGKSIAQKNEAGEFILDEAGEKTYKIGVKTRTFQDSKTSQDATLSELLEKVTILDEKTEFNLVSKKVDSLFTDASEFNVSSLWEIQNKKDVVESTPTVEVAVEPVIEAEVESFDNNVTTGREIVEPNSYTVVSEIDTLGKIVQTATVEQLFN